MQIDPAQVSADGRSVTFAPPFSATGHSLSLDSLKAPVRSDAGDRADLGGPGPQHFAPSPHHGLHELAGTAGPALVFAVLAVLLVLYRVATASGRMTALMERRGDGAARPVATTRMAEPR